MRMYLRVRDGSTDTYTLYYYDIPVINVPLEKGFHVEVPYGSLTERDGEGLGMIVDHSYLEVNELRFGVQLREVVIDPPEHWENLLGRAMAWRTEVDGAGDQLHANLLYAGWVKYP